MSSFVRPKSNVADNFGLHDPSEDEIERMSLTYSSTRLMLLNSAVELLWRRRPVSTTV
jgi:hypothetical protein